MAVFELLFLPQIVSFIGVNVGSLKSWGFASKTKGGTFCNIRIVNINISFEMHYVALSFSMKKLASEICHVLNKRAMGRSGAGEGLRG